MFREKCRRGGSDNVCRPASSKHNNNSCLFQKYGKKYGRLDFTDFQNKWDKAIDDAMQGASNLQTKILLCANVTFQGGRNCRFKKCAKIFHSRHWHCWKYLLLETTERSEAVLYRTHDFQFALGNSSLLVEQSCKTVELQMKSEGAVCIMTEKKLTFGVKDFFYTLAKAIISTTDRSVENFEKNWTSMYSTNCTRRVRMWWLRCPADRGLQQPGCRQRSYTVLGPGPNCGAEVLRKHRKLYWK